MSNFCPKCGINLNSNPNFCPECGYKLPKKSLDGSIVSKTSESDDINFKSFIVEHYESKPNMIVFHILDLLEESMLDYDMLMQSAKTGLEAVKSHLNEIDKFTKLSPEWEEAKNSYRNAMLVTLKMINGIIASGITSDITTQRQRDEIQSKIDEATEHMDKFGEHFDRFQKIFKSLF